MKEAVLGQRQIFGMLRKSLEKRVIQRYEQTRNAAEIVEAAVALLIRDALSVADFSFMFPEIIREIYLTAKPNDCLRRHCVYFQNYFSDEEEWQTVIHRLFKNKEEYHEFTKETCLYRELLEKKARETAEKSDFQFDLVSIFKDTNGKRYTWTLRDTKRVSRGLEGETAEVLEILTTLTIFQAAGVRRFAEYVKFKSVLSSIDAWHEADPEEQEESPALESPEDKQQISVRTEQKELTSKSSNERINQKPLDQGTADQADKLHSLLENLPLNEGSARSFANNPIATKSPHIKKTAENPQESQTSNRRPDKAEEHSKQVPEKKSWEYTIKKLLGKV
ncbi:hypothetical protein [Candidatus Enterococcus murrayae]|uniref:Uncharacterized protein n=1 Tax=Candidatus Enterococcus murrayae TaxID=2815321 RepID=A0ABS3HMR0_9ENTE|nr:hypothetical protein [Enterococcus sp. MJM16]MBO0454749.1 hypothetical protein [Enterococcus sp. MJM16]